ncbi:MAG: N-acetylmuramoyl-L-alanine amidase [Verrucomicrobiota bacterium]
MKWRALACGILLATTLPLRAQWAPVEIEDRDYLSLESVALFYGMEPPSTDGEHGGKTVFLAEGGGRSIRMKTDGREALLNGIRHWMAFPLVIHEGKPHISRMDLDKVFEPAFRPNEFEELPIVGTVILDPGHGGHDRGARSDLGNEKDYALDLTARVRKRLENAGVKTVQTRLSDFFVPLRTRPAMTKNYKDPIFVSLHFNAAGWKPSANGIEIFTLTPRGTPSTGKTTVDTPSTKEEDPGDAMEPASTVLANAIYTSMLAGTDLHDRGLKRARFLVLRQASVPAVLIEGGFLTNPHEAAEIHTPAFRDRLADSIVRGILAYADLAESGTVPKGVREYEGNETTEFVPLN